MERRGGLCIVRYGAEPDLAWKMGRIMLKYRPIAPKPVTGGASAAPPAPADGGGAGRGKRKGGAGRDGRRGRKSRKTLAAAKIPSTAATTSDTYSKKVDSPVSHPLSSSPSSSSNSYSSSPPPPPLALLKVEQSVVTLSLMPETPERKDENKTSGQPASPPQLDLALPCLTHLWRPEPARESAFQRPSTVEVVAPRPVRPAGSWVTLECVEETWRDGEICAGAAADAEVRRGMNGETGYPAFISDKYDRVAWVNEAYKNTVVGAEEDEEVRVALVTKGNVPAGRAFTCRVRVRYASRRGRGTLAAPCDVWRFEDGSLAWRLDVKAALSLGLL